MPILVCCFCFFKQKTAYEMRISDWSSDVCSSDLTVFAIAGLSRLIEQVATQLADVAERRGIDAVDFIPKACRAELAAERERTTGAEHRAPRDRKSTRLNSSH